MIKQINKKEIRNRKHLRVRKKVCGTPDCPRLCVFRSNTNIYAQIIDDTTGTTLVSASSLDKDVKSAVAHGGNVEAASAVGKKIAEKALGKEIKDVVFDRGGYIYHGRIAALAEAAREAGLSF